ncbi:DUF4476 domain-containing protein [Hymenobacter busanensis]|uniref:DUF4476 domain-containing protein n=1 Tax=Hymenobacter busanensis TaxID=2607656 RepID=A0A7L5A010_9BACT|nr:DUF4476 domain-containing protein [Hymenobacter busanensis]KAA9331274.1 DUF4476 domain-containing protein [Hymenobacter busanensis]QHJ08426.1 DUF4476 domain-containing protein [Hymenobacter busanensis]
MKRILLLCLGLVLLAQAAMAIPAGMAVRSERGLPFRLRLDGQRIGGRYGLTQVRFDRLAPGYHWAEFQVPAGRGVINYRTQVRLPEGRESRFVLVLRNGRPPLLTRFDEIPLAGWANYRGGPVTDYGYRHEPTPYGNANGWPTPGNADDWYNDRDGNENGYGNNGSYNQQPGNGGYSQYPSNGAGNQYPGNGGNYNQGYPNGAYGNNYRHVLDPREVDDLLRAVQSKPFDSSKLTLAKQALEQSDVRAEDLRRLLAGLDFENSRVDLAKFAFAHVADRQNFYRVYEAFSFDSSVQEVQRFVGNGRS